MTQHEPPVLLAPTWHRPEGSAPRRLKIFLSIVITAVQGIATIALMLLIYLVFAVLDYEGGIDGFIGMTIIRPIIGGVVAVGTAALCLVVGLPIRLIERVNEWWVQYFFVSITGVVIGIALLALSLTPAFVETVVITTDDGDTSKEIPNILMAVTGWFVTAFSVMHSFPPRFITDGIAKMLTRLYSKLRAIK